MKSTPTVPEVAASDTSLAAALVSLTGPTGSLTFVRLIVVPSVLNDASVLVT